MNSPTVSIVTPVLNGEKFIAAALASVPHEPDLEHIVVDGGSTDATCAIVASVPGVTLSRQPGTGLYAALNHGIRQARAPIIGLLNADDEYFPGAVQAACVALRGSPQADLVTGTAEVFAEDGDGARDVRALHARPERLRVTPENMMLGVPLLNARFYRRTLFDRIGLFLETLDASADREFLLRLALADRVEKLIAVPIYRYRAHPGSKTLGGDPARNLKFALEHLELAGQFASAHGGNAELAALAMRWSDASTITALNASLRCGDFRSFGGLLRRAARGGPDRWFGLLSALSGKLRRRWTRGGNA